MRARDVRIGRMYAFPTNPGPWFRYAVPARVMSRAPGNRVLVLLPDGVPATPLRGELPRASLVWVDADSLVSSWEEWPAHAASTRADMTAVVGPLGRRPRRQRRTDAGRPVARTRADALVVAPDRRAAASARRRHAGARLPRWRRRLSNGPWRSVPQRVTGLPQTGHIGRHDRADISRTADVAGVPVVTLCVGSAHSPGAGGCDHDCCSRDR